MKYAVGLLPVEIEKKEMNFMAGMILVVLNPLRFWQYIKHGIKRGLHYVNSQ